MMLPPAEAPRHAYRRAQVRAVCGADAMRHAAAVAVFRCLSPCRHASLTVESAAMIYFAAMPPRRMPPSRLAIRRLGGTMYTVFAAEMPRFRLRRRR